MSHAPIVVQENPDPTSSADIAVVHLEPTTPRKRRRSSRHQVIILAALAALAVGILSSASPAGIELIDTLYRSAFGFVVVLAASRSQRWALAMLSGVASVSAASLALQIASLVSLVLLVAMMRTQARQPSIGAAIGALSIVTLLLQGQGPLWRLTAGGVADPVGTSAVLTAVAVAPVLLTSWKTLSRKQRTRAGSVARRSVLALSAVLIVTAAAFGASVSPLRSALEDSRASVELATDGDLDGATELLEAANESWERANGRLSGPWMIPSRLIPVLGQHVRAAQILTGQSSAVTEAAAAVTGTVDPDAFISNGTFNVEEIDANLPTIDALAATLERATELAHTADSPWLIGPFRDRVALAGELLEPASGVVGASTQGLHVANDLLGSSQPTEILLMFSTPAEARGSGGFVGNWAVVSAADGRLEITEQYRSRELNELLEDVGASLDGDDGFVSRYARYDIEEHIQDVTISPDFPSVARVTADLFAQATGTTVEAVVLIDPFVVQQLLAFTGPIEVDSGVSLRSNSLLDYLLVDQYERFPEDEGDREAELSGVTKAVFDALLDNPPDPIPFVTEFAPLAEQDRLALWLRSDPEGSIVDRLGVDGTFPSSTGDLVGVVHQNAGQNKVDTFLQRTVDITTVLNRTENTATHDITVTLENSAPSSGLPAAIIGSNDQNLEPGANSMLLSVYSDTPVSRVSIDGNAAPFETSTEFGVEVVTLLVTVPSQETITLEVEASGPVDLSSGYETVLVSQPLINPDRASWHIQTNTGQRILPGSDGWTATGSGVEWTASVEKDRWFSFAFDS